MIFSAVPIFFSRALFIKISCNSSRPAGGKERTKSGVSAVPVNKKESVMDAELRRINSRAKSEAAV